MSGDKRCNHCGIVISELLAFVKCKVDVMDEISLCQIVVNNFTEREIEDAKNLLADILNTRKTLRKGDGRKQRNVQDIISAIKSSEPNIFPEFVARNLHKLPPVSFDYVDVSKLLKDICNLRQDLGAVQYSYGEVIVTNKRLEDEISIVREQVGVLQKATVSKEVDVNNTISEIAVPLPVKLPSIQTVNTSRIASLPTANKTTPKDRSIPARPTTARRAGSLSNPKTDDKSSGPTTRAKPTLPRSKNAGSRSSLPVSVDLKTTGPSSVTAKQVEKPVLTSGRTCSGPTDGSVTENTTSSGKKLPVDNDGYTLVTHKRFTCKRGAATAVSSTRIKAAPQVAHIFISQLDSQTSEEDVKEYIAERGESVVRVQKLGTRDLRRPYASFHLTVLKEREETFLGECFWPEHIQFRQFDLQWRKQRSSNAKCF